MTLAADAFVTAQFDRLNVAFVTSFTVPANFYPARRAYDFCNLAATDAGLGSNFWAWNADPGGQAPAQVER